MIFWYHLPDLSEKGKEPVALNTQFKHWLEALPVNIHSALLAGNDWSVDPISGMPSYLLRCEPWRIEKRGGCFLRKTIETNFCGYFWKLTKNQQLKQSILAKSQPIDWIGASGQNRTGTVLPPRDFKSLASTNFATEATSDVLVELRILHYAVPKLPVFFYFYWLATFFAHDRLIGPTPWISN